MGEWRVVGPNGWETQVNASRERVAMAIGHSKWKKHNPDIAWKTKPFSGAFKAFNLDSTPFTAPQHEQFGAYFGGPVGPTSGAVPVTTGVFYPPEVATAVPTRSPAYLTPPQNIGIPPVGGWYGHPADNYAEPGDGLLPWNTNLDTPIIEGVKDFWGNVKPYEGKYPGPDVAFDMIGMLPLLLVMGMMGRSMR